MHLVSRRKVVAQQKVTAKVLPAKPLAIEKDMSDADFLVKTSDGKEVSITKADISLMGGFFKDLDDENKLKIAGKNKDVIGFDFTAISTPYNISEGDLVVIREIARGKIKIEDLRELFSLNKDNIVDLINIAGYLDIAQKDLLSIAKEVVFLQEEYKKKQQQIFDKKIQAELQSGIEAVKKVTAKENKAALNWLPSSYK